MFYNMVFGHYVSALLLSSFQAGKVQDALNLNLEIASWPYARRYFTFNFKGRGDAQLWILNSDKTKQFKPCDNLLVEIGGGTNHDQVYVIDNKNNCFSTRVNNITSEKEYRSFWIRGKWPKNILGVYYRVVVGFGSDSHKNKLLSTDDIDGSKMNMSIIRLSTSIDSLGEWQFASAGRTLGGCGDAIPCIDDDAQCCGVNLTCGKWNRIHTRMIGTCIPPSDFFPSLVFGDGKYPTACGIGEEVCGLEDDCSSNTCKAMTNTVKEVCDSGEVCKDNICQATPAITTVKWTTKSMATTTPTSTPPTTTQTTTAMLTQTSIAIATLVQNPTSTPITTLPNTTSTVNTNIANFSFNHTLNSNATTTTGSVITKSTSIPFTTLTPTTTTGTTKSNSNITTPCTTSTTAIPLPSIRSTSTTKTPPTISIPFTYTQTTKPISATINPPYSRFGITTTIPSPNPTVATTTTATTTNTQTTVPGPITSAITLTTTKSTTSKQAHTTTTVLTIYMQTTIFTVPFSSTQHVTELYMCESSMSSGCLVVTTDKASPSTTISSFFYTNRWAILGGTVGGLVFIGAATWILLSHAAQYNRSLRRSRRVSPPRTQNPDNENNIIDA